MKPRDMGAGTVPGCRGCYPRDRFEYNYESVLDTETTPIKSIDDNEMDHLLELFQ